MGLNVLGFCCCIFRTRSYMPCCNICDAKLRMTGVPEHANSGASHRTASGWEGGWCYHPLGRTEAPWRRHLIANARKHLLPPDPLPAQWGVRRDIGVVWWHWVWWGVGDWTQSRWRLVWWRWCCVLWGGSHVVLRPWRGSSGGAAACMVDQFAPYSILLSSEN
jgi:hypothetical protein